MSADSAARPLRFSVVVTNYNYRDYVAEAVDSALAQTRAALEVIVVDDGSSDGSADFIATHYADRPEVRLLRQPNTGQLAAFAAGVREAKGDVVAFLDADDIWEPDYLARVAQVYEANRDVDFVYTDMSLFGSASGLYSDVFHCEPRTRDLGLNVLSASFSSRPPWLGTATSAVSLTRALADRVLSLPSEQFPAWKTNADVCIVRGADILGAHKYFLREPLCRYRAHASNAWLMRKGRVDFRQRMRMERALDFYRTLGGIHVRWLRHVKYEFKTKPKPTREELKRYSRLLAKADLPWIKRIEHRLSMCWYFWRNGRHA